MRGVDAFVRLTPVAADRAMAEELRGGQLHPGYRTDCFRVRFWVFRQKQRHPWDPAGEVLSRHCRGGGCIVTFRRPARAHH